MVPAVYGRGPVWTVTKKRLKLAIILGEPKWGLVREDGTTEVCTVCFQCALGFWCTRGCGGRFCEACFMKRRERGLFCLRCHDEVLNGP